MKNKRLVFLTVLYFVASSKAIAQDINNQLDEIRTCSVPVFNENNNSSPSPSDGDFPLLGDTRYLWKSGTTLRVMFLDGDSVIHDRVKNIASEWSRYANIKFNFDNNPEAEIRISFKKGGSWSKLGKSASQVPKNEPTMNFGWLTPSSSDDSCRRVVLHEFGHALGFVHEHKHPEGGIKWNEEAVFSYYYQTQGWDRETTRYNVLEAASKDTTQYSKIDTSSIMMYPIPAELTTNGFSTGWNTELSQTDKEFAQKLYPFLLSNESRYGAAVLHPNGKAYFFAGDKYYRFDFHPDRVDKIGKTGVDGWKGLPANVDAAVSHPNGKAYFFAGDKYYRFDYTSDQVDKIGRIGIDGWKGVPNNIGAAVLHPNGKVYFFVGDKYYRFDFSSDKVDRIGKIGIDGWSGLPINIDCVVEHPNGKAYFFVGRKYYRFDYKIDKVDRIATVGIDGWITL